MPTLKAESIREIGYHVLLAAGASEENAKIVASHVADANLAGHDSHGLWRVAQYIEATKIRGLDPKARPEVVSEKMATVQINGNGTFGQVVAKFATDLAIKKASEYGIGLARMYNLAHTGRVGAWPEMAARKGMAAVMYTGLTGAGGIAPFGGREGTMATNPFAMAFPSSSGDVILLDFATSTGLANKVAALQAGRVAESSATEPWIVTKEGEPSSDLKDFRDGGAILPMGGLSSGHKGYALSFMVMLFGAIIGNVGSHEDLKPHYREDGSSIIVIDLGGMAAIDEVGVQVEEIVRRIKETPPMKGFTEVLYPGELEARSRRKRLANGVPIPPGPYWDHVVKVIEEYGLQEKLKGHMGV